MHTDTKRGKLWASLSSTRWGLNREHDTHQPSGRCWTIVQSWDRKLEECNLGRRWMTSTGETMARVVYFFLLQCILLRVDPQSRTLLGAIVNSISKSVFHRYLSLSNKTRGWASPRSAFATHRIVYNQELYWTQNRFASSDEVPRSQPGLACKVGIPHRTEDVMVGAITLEHLTYFVNLGMFVGISSTCNPGRNVLDVGNGRRDQDKANSRTPSLHARYHNLQGATAGFVEDMDLTKQVISPRHHVKVSIRTSSTRNNRIWESIWPWSRLIYQQHWLALNS